MASASPGCGSSNHATDAAPSAAVDTGAASLCFGKASQLPIDDMSGNAIDLVPPACGLPGAWYVGRGGAATTPGTITTPSGDPDQMWQCGSICQSLYSPLPDGFPDLAAAGDGGGGLARKAMCMAGQTGGTQYDWAAMGLMLAAADPAYQMPAFIDAGAFQGLDFWLWVSPGSEASLSAYLRVELIDRNQVAGAGVCNVLDTGTLACGGASASVPGSAVAENQRTGALLAADGTAVSALSAGWQHLRAPWSNLLPNPGYGGANEPALDPRTLAKIGFVIQQVTAGGAAVPFDFCVYQLGFLP